MKSMISIRHARIDERKKTFDWYCDIFENNDQMDSSVVQKYSFQEYIDDFEDFYFVASGKNKGSVMIIQNDDEEVGCLCYACFHLKQDSAELDIWLKDEKTCGKGYGTTAIKKLISYLRKEKNITRYIIRPSEKNIRAIGAYQKVGFSVVKDKKQSVAQYLKPEFIDKYGVGDYGLDDTAVLVLRYK
jgi:RimJ/RimL family protein N-acetyltransferase